MERKYIVQDWTNSPFEQWAKNFCARNQWRVSKVLGDYDDCLAYCAMCYVQVRKQYGATVNSPSHFMYFFKMWVEMEFNTLSTKDFKMRSREQELTDNENSLEAEDELSANLNVLMQGASSELKSVLSIILNAPQEMMEVLRNDASSCHPKQFWKAALRACGIDQSHSGELAKELRTLLTPSK